MKQLIKILALGLIFTLLSLEKASTQIESSLIGKYTAISGTEVETIEIFKDKVEAKIGGEVVEKYFFYKKEGDAYILQFVKVDVESIDFTENLDRKLVKVQVQETDDNNFVLNFVLPNGTAKEIIMSRN